MRNFKKIATLLFILLVTVVALPMPVSAATVCGDFRGTPESFSELICLFVTLINVATPIVAGLALLAFFWGLAQFILHAGDPKTHTAGKDLMFWGIIALFVMVSIWGIVIVLNNDLFGYTPDGLPFLPE